MISFECPHCGNHFEVKQELAGRDGWCRVCKNMVTIPGGTLTPAEELPAERREDRFNALFRYAARKADERKVQLHDTRRENRELREKVEQVDELTRKLEAAVTRIANLETDLATLPAHDGGDEALQHRVAALEDRLAGLAESVAPLAPRLDDAESAGARAAEDASGARDAAEQARNAAEQTAHALRDLTERHEDLRARLTSLGEQMLSDGSKHFEQDTALSALRASMTTLRDEVVARDTERITAAESAMAELRARLEAVEAPAEPDAALTGLRERMEAMEARLAEAAGGDSAANLLSEQVTRTEEAFAAAVSEYQDLREAVERVEEDLGTLRNAVEEARRAAEESAPDARVRAVPVPVDDGTLVPEVIEDDQPMLQSFLRFMQAPQGGEGEDA